MLCKRLTEWCAVAQRSRGFLVVGSVGSPTAADAEGLGAGLHQLLRASALPPKTIGASGGGGASPAASRNTLTGSDRSTSCLAGCKSGETKGEARRTLPPGAWVQPGSPVK